MCALGGHFEVFGRLLDVLDGLTGSVRGMVEGDGSAVYLLLWCGLPEETLDGLHVGGLFYDDSSVCVEDSRMVFQGSAPMAADVHASWRRGSWT